MNRKTLQLGRMLASVFHPATAIAPRCDVGEEARQLAGKLHVEVRRLAAGDFHVSPPRWLRAEDDPYEDDHVCQDWTEVLRNLRDYAILADMHGVPRA